MSTFDAIKKSIAITVTSYSTEIDGIATTLAAVWYLLMPPFIEGTSGGWKSADMHNPTFAERAHEPEFTSYYGLNYAAVVGVVLGFNVTYPKVRHMLFLLGGLIIWFVLVARTAVATHATDHLHSIVKVPYYSTIPGVLTACMPATFSVVKFVAKLIKRNQQI